MATTTINGVGTARPGRMVVRLLGYALSALIGILVVITVWAWWRVRACLPQLDGAVQARGLAAPVQVLRDARGVPHVRAESLEDAYFTQGYITAQDRLWQMDLSRRLANGELSEIFGARTLEHDIENRRLGFRVAAERGAAELPPDFQRLISAYARGVNAFMTTHLDRLPIEFTMLRYKPRPWREADSLSVALNMAKMLSTSWQGDLMRERVRARLSPELYADLFPVDSPLERPVAEQVTGPAHAVPPDAARNSQPTVPVRRPDAHRDSDTRLDPVLSALTSAGDETAFALGSNNWVVSGAHTESGKPLLSNDPHIAHSVPSVWYMMQLEAPGLDVSGVTLPGAPSVIIGHNERIAWGMTNTGPDVQDLYVEKFDPSNPDQYLHDGQWVQAEVRHETIKVRDAEDYKLTVRTTRHGPIISDENGRSLALCWTALQRQALQFPFLAMNQTRNWQEFRDAIRHFTGPEQNMVYADVDGNIGYYAPAWVPVRRQSDGSVPVPGDSDAYDWTGYIPFEDLPHAYNPASGLIATANSRVIPADYPYFFTHTWAPPFRTARIFQLLASGTPGRSCGTANSSNAGDAAQSHDSQKAACFNASDMLRIDMDIHPLDDTWLAQALVRAAQAHAPDRDDARQAIEILRQWNGDATADSAAPLICANTFTALRERLLEPKLGAELAKENWSLSEIFTEDVIDHQLTRWLPPTDSDFNATLMTSLDDGLMRIEARLPGRGVASWRWGDTIPLTFHHPLDSLPFIGHRFDVGPYPQFGTANSVKATTPGAGPSMRMVVDLANLDNSVQNLTLGESGQITSPYYSDQFQAWYHGSSFPMLFSDKAVDQGAVHRLTLEPSRQQAIGNRQ
ncbi:MAG TPA: penicillin acylase family protein [Terriglobia bacterium]|nr:penicillin acylase family protein [Terriglobia bacterium]